MEITNLEIKKQFFDSLNERQKRHFAAIEAKDLGYGGQKLVSDFFGIDADTIHKGELELNNKETLQGNRARKKGGGRKKNVEQS